MGGALRGPRGAAGGGATTRASTTRWPSAPGASARASRSPAGWRRRSGEPVRVTLVGGRQVDGDLLDLGEDWVLVRTPRRARGARAAGRRGDPALAGSAVGPGAQRPPVRPRLRPAGAVARPRHRGRLARRRRAPPARGPSTRSAPTTSTSPSTTRGLPRRRENVLVTRSLRALGRPPSRSARSSRRGVTAAARRPGARGPGRGGLGSCGGSSGSPRDPSPGS